MPRANHRYNPPEWIRVLDHYGLNNADVARKCGVTVETIGNILGRTTLSARRSTKKKLVTGLVALGVAEADPEQLFIN